MIKLHNTKTRAKEIFTPIDANNVRMYVCGPTVYDRAHLGNGRPVVVFDVLYRLLRHVYGADHVTYVRNFTDVDDKINATALARQQAGSAGSLEDLIRERTEETIRWYHDDMDALGALRPNHEPRATEYIPQMIEMIETLIKKGFAYSKPISYGHNSKAVYFDSKKAPEHSFFSVEQDKRYGELSGRSVDEMVAGAKAEIGEGKANPMDFVLWKPSTVDEPGWHSPWGYGRPGWHIECSAMSKALLGEVFDIHGGGLDLQFPHHENEIAQSCCANGTNELARFWLHNEMLQVEGKKMSKSLGNFFTVRDLLEQGYPGEVIRMVYLGTHYSKPMDWTAEKAVEAESRIFGFVELVARYADLIDASKLLPDQAIIAALGDDLNTHEALRLLGTMNDAASATRLARNIEFLGILSWEQLRAKTEDYNRALEILPAFAARLQKLREAAKMTKNYSEVDALKTAISAANFSVMMNKDDVFIRPEMDFQLSKLESLK